MSLLAAVDRVDLAAERAIDRLRGTPVDRLMYGLSEAANHSVLWHVLGGISAAAPGGRGRYAAELSVVLGAESAIVNGLLKGIVRRPRPPERIHDHRLRVPLTSSFPSGHASSAFTAVSVIGHRRPTWRRPLLVLASLVAASRAWVGIHHLSDVVGGALVGVALGRVAVRAIDAAERRAPVD